MTKNKLIWAILVALLLFVMIFLVTPIYGVNIKPNSTVGIHEAGGHFGQLHPLSVYADGGGDY